MTQLRSGPATTSGTPIKFREMLEQSESRLAETGCYDGITDLALKAEDPLKYESLHTRLRSTVVSARETSKRISASPGIREVGECVVGLYTPEGDSVVFFLRYYGARTYNESFYQVDGPQRLSGRSRDPSRRHFR